MRNTTNKTGRTTKTLKNNKWLFIGLGISFLFIMVLVINFYFQKEEKGIPEEEQVDTSHFISQVPLHFTVFLPRSNSEMDFESNITWKKIQEMTNIYFDFISPLENKEAEEILKQLLVSGNYPDIIYNTTSGYPGGYSKAIRDGVYINIAPYLEAYAPNYEKRLNENKALSEAYTETNELPGFWRIYEPTSMPIIGGLSIRNDFLEASGVEIPVTIDDWTNFLRILRDEENIELPLLLGQQNGVNVTAEFLSAFGIGAAPVSIMNSEEKLFYPDQGVMKYGAVEPGYQEYLLLMNQWYDEGLLDQNFGIRSFTDIFERKNLIGQGKAAINWQYAEWFTNVKTEQGKSVNMTALPMPKLNQNDSNVQWMVSRNKFLGELFAITTSCQHVEELVEFFDFLYSEEGVLLTNYGIEGKTYEMIDGEPVFTDLIMNYDKGAYEGVGKYVNNHNGLVYDLSFTETFQNLIYNKEAIDMKEVWLESADLFYTDYHLTIEESSRLIKIMSSITSYVEEYTIKGIVDKKVALNWDDHIETIRSMGLDEALSIMQKAYNRREVTE